jgi:hypothetical protein
MAGLAFLILTRCLRWPHRPGLPGGATVYAAAGSRREERHPHPGTERSSPSARPERLAQSAPGRAPDDGSFGIRAGPMRTGYPRAWASLEVADLRGGSAEEAAKRVAAKPAHSPGPGRGRAGIRTIGPENGSPTRGLDAVPIDRRRAAVDGHRSGSTRRRSGPRGSTPQRPTLPADDRGRADGSASGVLVDRAMGFVEACCHRARPPTSADLAASTPARRPG